MASDNAIAVVTGFTITAVFAILFGAIAFQINANKQFDVACINNNKQVVWSTKNGADSPVKECK